MLKEVVFISDQLTYGLNKISFHANSNEESSKNV